MTLIFHTRDGLSCLIETQDRGFRDTIVRPVVASFTEIRDCTLPTEKREYALRDYDVHAGVAHYQEV